MFPELRIKTIQQIIFKQSTSQNFQKTHGGHLIELLPEPIEVCQIGGKRKHYKCVIN